MNKDGKDLCKDSKTTRSIYGFIKDEWLKDTCEKTCQKGGVDVNMRKPEEKKNEESKRNEGS